MTQTHLQHQPHLQPHPHLQHLQHLQHLKTKLPQLHPDKVAELHKHFVKQGHNTEGLDKNNHTDYKKYIDAGKRQGHLSKTEFSYDKMAEKLKSIIDSKFDKPKVLQLPTLKKLELPKINKI